MHNEYPQLLASYETQGESYHPWHGTLDALRECLTNAAARYEKPVVVAETAFQFAEHLRHPGQHQRPGAIRGGVGENRERSAGHKGLGIFWRGTEYQRIDGSGLAGFDTRSFFDRNGGTLPVATAFGQLAAPVRLGARADEGNTRVTWPLSGAAMSLLSCTNLSPPIQWTPVTNPVKPERTDFFTAVPSDASQRFFRLSIPDSN